MTSRCQGLFPPHPFFKGKALGTRLRRRRHLPSRLVRSAKQRQYPCSGSVMDSKNYRKCVWNFLLCWLANLQWLFYQANRVAYLNPGTQVGARDKLFGAVSQNKLLRSCRRFPALFACYIYLFDLIGSLDYLCRLWLVKLITLGFRFKTCCYIKSCQQLRLLRTIVHKWRNLF